MTSQQNAKQQPEDPITQIAEYSQTAAALAELTERYAVVPDATKPEGYKALKIGIREVKGYRTSLEKMRKEIKAPALERCRLIDAEAKDITAKLLTIETPMQQAKAAEDERIAQIERDRVAALQARIDAVHDLARRAAGASSDEIRALIDQLTEFDPGDNFQDMTHDALAARNAVAQTLDDALTAQVEREAEDQRRAEEAAALAAEREQMEKDRKAEEERRAQAQAAAEADIAAKREQMERVQEAERARQAEESAALAAEREAMAKERAELERQREEQAAIAAAATEEAKPEEPELTADEVPEAAGLAEVAAALAPEDELPRRSIWREIGEWVRKYDISNEASGELVIILRQYF